MAQGGFTGDTQQFGEQHNQREFRVSTMSAWDRFFYRLERGENKYLLMGILAGVLALSMFALSLILVVIPISAYMIKKYLNAQSRTFEFPLRIPIHAKVADGSNVPVTGDAHSEKTHKNYLAKGTIYLGQDRETDLQVWLTDDDMLTHLMLLGTTKSGKTFVIFQFMLQCLIKNSGFLYVDAKGDISTLKNICQLLRRFGRNDDFLLISFLPYDKPQFGDYLKPTNCMNIFKTATATTITELIVSMLSGADDMWKDRTIAFTSSSNRALTVARDLGLMEVSANKLLELTELAALEKFVWQDCEQHPQLYEAAEGLRSYLLGLPSYDKAKQGGKQDSTTKDQHGYVVMQLLRALNDLSYNYGHIFGQENSDIDMADVVFNRRNLVVSLPALSRSVSTLNMLARIIMSSVRQVGAIALGDKIEGSVRLNIDARPSNARNIYLIMFDEVGYMMTEGISIMPAQFRAFNLSVLFSGQSYANLKKGDELEAQEIWENTNVKLFGRYTGGADGENFQKMQGLAGEYLETRISSLTRKEGGSSFLPSQEVNLHKEYRLQLDTLATQENGEFTVVLAKKSSGQSKGIIGIARTRMMFPLPKESITHVFINEFIYVSLDRLASLPHDFQHQLRATINMGGIHSNLNELYLRSNVNSPSLVNGVLQMTQDHEARVRLYQDDELLKPQMFENMVGLEARRFELIGGNGTPAQVLVGGVDELKENRLFDRLDTVALLAKANKKLWQETPAAISGLEYASLQERQEMGEPRVPALQDDIIGEKYHTSYRPLSQDIAHIAQNKALEQIQTASLNGDSMPFGSGLISGDDTQDITAAAMLEQLGLLCQMEQTEKEQMSA